MPNCDILDNSAFEGPCVVGSHLCSGPSLSFDSCNCSNLAFVLNSACDACIETDSDPSWMKYAQVKKCQAIPDPNPPLPTHSAFVVPPWAISMAAATPTPSSFSLQDAVNLANSNFSIAAASPSSESSNPSVPPTPQASPSSSVGDTSPSASSLEPLRGASQTKSNAGTIAGVVIGVIIALALIVVGVWLVLRRRRQRHMAPSAVYRAALRSGMSSPYQPVPLRAHEDSPQHSPFELPPDRADSPAWMATSQPASLRSQSRFLEHTE
ncbi:hypothetical protein MIND_01012900 [Mycena indigotica]|uniref:Uncharacterized protein n=1 Tax=Mycena indigotica TaxID=2126181 RepID=A0A8H6S833_9AGAR|nr:uncharacterized protein MIND_01012900 [Mycena indigotica]KAF7294755.1 hypothetical protein MIND_01012900 [Mycena indigotica]